jgi:hypothetical protein
MKLSFLIKHRKMLFWLLKIKLKGVLMPKKEKKVKDKKGPNREKVKAGDVYVVVNEAEIVDVDGDGVTDLVATHEVTKNGALFVESKTVWYGLEDDVKDAFLAILEEEGVLGEFETTKFRQVNRDWKRLTQFLSRLNKLGDAKADEVGDPPEEEEV